jgi:hypothetical protein
MFPPLTRSFSNSILPLISYYARNVFEKVGRFCCFKKCPFNDLRTAVTRSLDPRAKLPRPLEERSIASFYDDLFYWTGYNKVKEKEVK